MATASQVKTGLDEISAAIRAQRAVMAQAKTKGADASAALGALATNFGDVITTINGFAADSADYFERTSKAELAKLTAEFNALKTIADAVAGINV